MKCITVIPARTNSNRLPNKNFRKFFGKPMIAWVLEEVAKSELFDKIVISTDLPIKWLNKDQDLIVEHIRRGNITQYAKTVDDVCLDVLEKYKDYEYLCCVYATGYAVTAYDLMVSFRGMLQDGKVYAHSYGMMNGDYELDNGGFYWAQTRCFSQSRNLMGLTPYRHKLDMVDINTLQDFAEAKLHCHAQTPLWERFNKK